jgi:hypothetical protein
LTFIVFKKPKEIFSTANVVLKLKMSHQKFKLSVEKRHFKNTEELVKVKNRFIESTSSEPECGLKGTRHQDMMTA